MLLLVIQMDARRSGTIRSCRRDVDVVRAGAVVVRGPCHSSFPVVDFLLGDWIWRGHDPPENVRMFAVSYTGA